MIIPDWVAYTFLAGAFIATIGVLLMALEAVWEMTIDEMKVRGWIE